VIDNLYMPLKPGASWTDTGTVGIELTRFTPGK
jgi:hypothetical protein